MKYYFIKISGLSQLRYFDKHILKNQILNEVFLTSKVTWDFSSGSLEHLKGFVLSLSKEDVEVFRLIWC